MGKTRLFLALAFVTMFLSVAGLAQTGPRPALADVLRSAVAARDAYLGEFRNLLSFENRTVAVYSKDGNIKRRKMVRSKFVVYESTKEKGRISEFRNVVEVDGNPVPNSEKRVEDFFVSVQKAESSARELERIAKESQKYDDELAINGFTLFQGVILAENLRPFFEFNIVGRETVSGADTLAVEYRQTRASQFIRLINPPPPGGSIGVYYDAGLDTKNGLNERLSGRIWLDAANYRIWKEERIMSIQPDGYATPVVVARTDFEYGPSDFGILTPRKIVHTQYQVLKKERSSRKDVGVTLDYEKFRRPEVEVKVTESTGH